jgi:hypothetical protein
MNWRTASASVDGTEITIQYPAEIPVDVTALAENKPFSLGTDPGFPDYILPLTTTDKIALAEVTTDLKYLFYLTRDIASNTVSLYKGTVSLQTVEKIADYTLSSLKIPDDQLYTLMPLVTNDGFTIYNGQPNPTSNQVTGNIIDTENNAPLYIAPCALDRFGNVAISPDKQHIVWNCRDDGAYISDWKSTKKVLHFSPTMNPTAISFLDNERIKFANATEGNDMLRAPYHSIKLDGTDLRLEEGDVYLGY